jgi:hypothetical protein
MSNSLTNLVINYNGDVRRLDKDGKLPTYQDIVQFFLDDPFTYKDA